MNLIFLIPKLLRSFSVFICLPPLHWGDTLSIFYSWGCYSRGGLMQEFREGERNSAGLRKFTHLPRWVNTEARSSVVNARRTCANSWKTGLSTPTALPAGWKWVQGIRQGRLEQSQELICVPKADGHWRQLLPAPCSMGWAHPPRTLNYAMGDGYKVEGTKGKLKSLFCPFSTLFIPLELHKKHPPAQTKLPALLFPPVPQSITPAQ